MNNLAIKFKTYVHIYERLTTAKIHLELLRQFERWSH